MVMQLRPYQSDALAAVYEHLRTREDNPVVVIPTGGGKTAVMATLCDDAVTRWNGRVLVLAHVKELLEQTAGTLDRMAPHLHVGLYSAGLKRRDTGSSVIVAGIQSVFRRAAELDAFDLILIDEAHMIPPEGEGMYQSFLKEARIVNPHLRVIGLTATPFRMTSGMICQKDHFLNHICYEVGVRELIRDGYLCPLRTKAGVTKADPSGLHVRGGEFVVGEVENLMDQVALVRAACAEIAQQTKDRQSVLIFSSGIQHGRHIVEVLRSEYGAECGFITGETPAAAREALIARFRHAGGRELFGNAQPLKFLCNVNVLTTGFDAPNVDCVVMLRPTLSPGLYYQMAGRGFRLCEGKADCLVLDFGGNVLRHGPVDQIRVSDPQGSGMGQAPAKECPECQALIHAAYSKCPECGYEFPPPQRQHHSAQATSAGILSDQPTDTRYRVQGISYSAHTKRDATPEARPTLRVDYEVGFRQYKSEWVCIEHDGYARQKALAWWQARSHAPFPSSVAEAAELANAGALAETRAVVVRSKPREYDRIISHELGPKSEWDTPDTVDEASLPEPVFAEDDIPF